VINEDAPTMSAGTGGFSGSANASGPVAGFDPMLGSNNEKKPKLTKRKYKRKNCKEEVLDERLGGKGYSKKATKGGGDWEDSDRGAGNKATRRAGGKVEKKSPTYKAHVLNKEEVELDEAERKLGDRLHRKRKLYDRTVKKAMDFARREGEAAGHARYRMGQLDREMDKVKDKMKKEK